MPAEFADAFSAGHFIRSPADVVAKVQAFADAGCQHFVIASLDATTSMETTERFIREVVPNVSVPG